jgi:hypothetical protein
VSHELIEPFDVDDGQLDGIAPHEAFAMGAEFAMFRRLLVSSEPFTRLCLASNADRLVKMVERRGRFVEDRPTNCEGWREIWVGDFIKP